MEPKKEKTNLQKLLAMKAISTKTVQTVIGAASEKTAYNKINGFSEFTLSEARIVKDAFFPEYDFDYVFAGYTEMASGASETANAAAAV